MVVASGMFLTAVILIIGALVSLETASRKVRATQIAMDNIGAAVDSMSRTMRMGSIFNCGCGGASMDTPVACEMTPPPGDIDYGTCIAFEHQNGNVANPGDQYRYFLQGGQIMRSKLGGTPEALTAPELAITDLKFWVGGVTVSSQQPYVTMVIRGIAVTGPRTSTRFNIQTTISQRAPNFDLTP